MDTSTLEQIIDVVEKQSLKYMARHIESECEYTRGKHEAAQQILTAILDTLEAAQ